MRCLLYITLGMLIVLWGCATPTLEETPTVATPILDTVAVPADFFDQPVLADAVYFEGILDSSYYKAPDSFAQALRQLYQLPQGSIITRYEQTALYGCADSMTHLEVLYPTPSKSCSYASMHRQLIFDGNGQLVYHSFAEQAQFIPYALDSMPIYLEATHGCDGLGQHAIYCYQDGHLINVLHPILDNMPTTYDVRTERPLFGKRGLQPRLVDLDADGHLDVVLEGSSYDERRRRVPIRYAFHYIPAKDYYLFQD